MEIKEVLEQTVSEVNNRIEKLKGEMPSKADMTALNSEIEKLKGLAEANKTQEENYNKIIETVKGLETSIVKLNAKLEQTEIEKENEIETPFDFFKKAFKSKSFEEFRTGVVKAGKEIAKLKDYSISSGRTGTVMVTNVIAKLVSEFGRRTIHMRDILGMTPSPSTIIVYDKVTAVTEYSTVNTENGDLVQSSFTTAEQTDTGTRIGNFDFISKNVLRMANWAVQRYAALFEKMILYKEDFLLLYGEGANNEQKGLKNEATSITMVGQTFAALAFDTVASYYGGAQAKVKFVAAHGLKNGQLITIANATHVGYNATFSVNVFDELNIILDVAYVAEAANLVDAWTGSVFENMYNKVDLAGTADAVIASVAFMKSRDMAVNAILMNPTDAALIFTDKTTTGEPTSTAYGIAVERRGMDIFVGGTPVIEMNAVKAGDLFVGEFSPENVELFVFEPISVEYTEDTTTKKSNKVMISAEEQITYAVYNPFAFGYAKIATLKTQLEKP